MLDKIIEVKKTEVNAAVLPPAAEVTHVSFYDQLKSARDIALIAEVKKASPSKGIIKANFNPVDIAIGYQNGGANAVSVLTDRQFFQGAPEYLTNIKQTINLPVLRKDFIIDPIQVEESKRIGADAILLIAEALEAEQLHELYLQAYELGMDVLVEVHASLSLEAILRLFTPKIIGVNNRDLTTFTTTLQQTKEIGSMIPEGALFVSESGIYTASDLLFVKQAGASAVLVGESLMRAVSPEEGIRKLFEGIRTS